ncbi:hypothetical protein [Gynurincola endophyticus]|uniref:hypothetical protein n=1 Tax=Gynurincola endophyticus TaxID=2479004 RepID=UPI000F8F5564|nr:hypothetical protein [Gynurincola endophyticus]
MDIYQVYINDLEEWEMLKDEYQLSLFFQKAQSVLVGGGVVRIVRKQFNNSEVVLEDIDQLEVLLKLKEKMWRFL